MILSHTQPSLFHPPYVQKLFLPNVEQLILGVPGQNHWEVGRGQDMFPAEKLCHLQDCKVNLYRAVWDECTVVPKTFSFPYCQGICLVLSSELRQSNFECYKRGVPTCPQLFQICHPTRVRLFSFMVQDNEHKMSVHHTESHSVTRLECGGVTSAHCNLCLRVQVILLPQPPELECSSVISVHCNLCLPGSKMESHHVDQMILTSAFQNAGITDMSHCTQPLNIPFSIKI
ncbi:hypothetical protein AAY473_001626 [Plecturocebus cupreus]